MICPRMIYFLVYIHKWRMILMGFLAQKYLTEKDGQLWLTEDERENLKISYRIKKIIFEEQSPFQDIMIADSYDFGKMLVLDGVVQTTSIDGYIYNEMISHIPLCIHPDPKKVLIIGGGDCGVAREVCRYQQVEQVEMVEIDERVVHASKTFLPEVSDYLADERVHYYYEDGVHFVRERAGEYDVIIVDSSDPVGPATALFEKEFYENIATALKDDGLMVCQSQSPIFHQATMKQSYERISDIFPAAMLYTAVVPTYPGGLWSFTIGSKKYQRLNPEICPTKETRYVNKSILSACFSLPQFLQQELERKK